MIRTAVFWIVTVVSTAFFSLVSIVGGLAGAPASLHDWVHRNWARSLLGAAGVRVEVRGLDRVRWDGPRILVANHQSLFDVFALFARVPASVRFVAKRELGRIPLFSHAMRAAGHVFIDRADRRAASAAMRAAGERMKRERLSLGLFPEGTRSRDGQLRAFRRGTFVLAIESQAPIVPVAVDGGSKVVSGGRVRPGTMVLQVGAPIATEGKTAADRDAVLEAAWSAIAEMLSSLRRTPGPSGGARPTDGRA